jgi:endonuclease/exonuclease/phosphatase family metal-dependent hydrolase
MNFMKKISGPKIICGDFNILPDTESVAILENGMRNLVKEFAIESTRTPLYRHYNNPDEPNFADYVFVSPDVNVMKFTVLPDVVSDHSPLLLEFT